MDRARYQQLVQSSPTFQTFSNILKQTVLEATGDRMKRFSEIFLSAQQALEKAKTNFLQENERITTELKHAVQRIKKDKRVDDEKRSNKADMATMQSLLHNLHNL